MYIIIKTEPDDLMPDVLSEDDGTPIRFGSKISALRYIDNLCDGFGVESEIFMVDDNIEICRIH
tara:strand:+ start:271 stop:462 length:192 start_codon:yes stop_codon:yes gene_type:complete